MKKKILIIEVLDFELTRNVLTKFTTSYDEIYIFISNRIANSISLDLILVQEAIKSDRLSFIEIPKITSKDVPAFMFFKIGGICSDISMGSIVDLISEDFDFFNTLRVFLGKESIDVYLVDKLVDGDDQPSGKPQKNSQQPDDLILKEDGVISISEPLFDEAVLESESLIDLCMPKSLDCDNALDSSEMVNLEQLDEKLDQKNECFPVIEEIQLSQEDTSSNYFFHGITEFNKASCLRFDFIVGVSVDDHFFKSVVLAAKLLIKSTLNKSESGSLASEELIFRNEMSQDQIFISLIYLALKVLHDKKPRSIESFQACMRGKYKSIKNSQLLDGIILYFRAIKICRTRQTTRRPPLVIDQLKVNAIITELKKYIPIEVEVLAEPKNLKSLKSRKVTNPD